MDICYFPGCTLKTEAKELDVCARKVAEKLGVNMVEIENWQCCGAEYATARDEIANKLSSVRALDYAKHHGGKLLTLCSACHNVIKRVNDDAKNDQHFALRSNSYLGLEEEYHGEAEVVHYVEMLINDVGLDKIKAAVVNPLDKRVGAYYGCLLLRPSSVMQFDNAENPTVMESIITALGGEAVKFSRRNECCGAYVGMKSDALAQNSSDKIVNSALSAGAEEIVTACPLCYYNLKKRCGDKIKVRYLTELMAEALGVNE
jgi:heterodisulfide reductase subunit B